MRWGPEYDFAISSIISNVRSVEQSSERMISNGSYVCANAPSTASRIYFSWLYAISANVTNGRSSSGGSTSS